MAQVAVANASEAPKVRLTIPSEWKARMKERAGSPFCNNMTARLLGDHPTDANRVMVRYDGAELAWPREHVHTT